MSFIIPEKNINIGEDVFHGNCVLGRAASGEKLSELVEKIDQPVVIAVDGPWGSGKSYFLKLWTGAHKKDNGGTAKVIYFDAFKHDYFDDPLVALVGQIFEDFSEGKAPEGKMKTLLKQAGRLVKPATRIALAVGTSFASEALGAAAAAATNALGKEAENALDPVWENEANRRDAMESFKNTLKDLTVENGSKGEPQKIVIIIDELDRCRPDFALNMLETIKHFFAVENVIFVLGVNLVELENSVKARYGGATNAGKYLQKFIQVRFAIEENLSHIGTDSVALRYFNHVVKSGIITDESYLKYLSYYLNNMELNVLPSLREIQRLITSAVIAPNTTDCISDNILIAGLLIMSVTGPETVEQAMNGTLRFERVNKLLSLAQGSACSDGNVLTTTRNLWRLCLDPAFIATKLEIDKMGYADGRASRPKEMIPRVAKFLFGAIDVTRFD